jgi:hypothetical protein
MPQKGAIFLLKKFKGIFLAEQVKSLNAFKIRPQHHI